MWFFPWSEEKFVWNYTIPETSDNSGYDRTPGYRFHGGQKSTFGDNSFWTSSAVYEKLLTGHPLKAQKVEYYYKEVEYKLL